MLRQDEIENNMENLINRPIRKNDSYKHAFTSEELFDQQDDVLRESDYVKTYFGVDNRKLLAAKIFNDAFYEILLDIINNNITFVIPLSFGKYGEICAETITGDKFIELYNKNVFKNLDYVLSGFSGSQIVFKYRRKDNSYGKKTIHIAGDLRKHFEQKMNEGKQYY